MMSDGEPSAALVWKAGPGGLAPGGQGMVPGPALMVKRLCHLV